MAKNQATTSRRSKKKEKRRVEKASDRLAPQKPSVAELLRDAKSGQLPDDQKWYSSELKLLYESFNPKIDQLFAHHNAANFGNNFEEYTVVEKKATELLEQIETGRYKLFCKLGLVDPSKHSKQYFIKKGHMAVHEYEIDIYRLRSFSRMKRGDLEGSVRDATEGLSIASIFARQDEEKKNHLEQQHPVTKTEIIMLVTRGMSLRELGHDLDGAYKDLRAACAGYGNTTDTWKCWPTYEDVVKELLIVMALRKVRDGAKRPHYTEAEVESWQKRLGLGLYSNERLKCLECGSKHDALMKCTGCNNAWFCNKACQRASWKKGHKKECKPSVVLHVLMDEEKSAIQKRVNEDGYFFMEKQKSVLVQDKETGEYFDSLTNKRVAFYPSEGLEWKNRGLEEACLLNFNST